jgi:hypothetical protein
LTNIVILNSKVKNTDGGLTLPECLEEIDAFCFRDMDELSEVDLRLSNMENWRRLFLSVSWAVTTAGVLDFEGN